MLTWIDPPEDCDGSRSVATFELVNLRFECTAYSDGSYGIDADEISAPFPTLRSPKKRIFVATGDTLSHPHESTEWRINRIAAKQALTDKLFDALAAILSDGREKERAARDLRIDIDAHLRNIKGR